MTTNTTITHAQVAWDDAGQPLSQAFGDVYFSRANGLEETRHVFLHHNQLHERWQQLNAQSFFNIAETGFGSGLNFLAAWQLWLNTAPINAQLHFISVEKYPLHKTDLIRALALWPELHELSQSLINAYPDFVGTGIHRLNFQAGRVKLTLIINDAAIGLQQLLATTHPLFASECAKIDAWFLDGFAPSKNPQMWSTELFTAIQQLSKEGTTAATFSAAGIVKNGLKAAGFQLEKVPGFGRKREMVKGYFQDSALALKADDFVYKGSFSPYPVPWTINLNKDHIDKRVVIIGGGLAGCSSAHSLAQRGWQVTLLERHPELASEASGNPQGVLYAKLSHKEEIQAEFNLSCLQYAQHFYQDYWQSVGDQCGVLQLAHNNNEALLHSNLQQKFSTAHGLVKAVTAAEASAIAGITLPYSALYFPQAGWINPRALCAELIKHPNIQVMTNTQALTLDYKVPHWNISGRNLNLQTPVVILANAQDALAFPYSQHLPIKSIRGQVSYLPATQQTKQLKTLLCGDGYMGPAQNDIHTIGATFNLKDNCTQVRSADHQTNITNLSNLLPAIAADWQALNTNELPGRVAFRCTLPDYLPAVGALPIADQLLSNFALLRKNSRAGIPLAGSYWPGLYINIGHGSRGLAYTPLCAEVLAAQINGEPPPTSRELINALNPARFLIRNLIKNKC